MSIRWSILELSGDTTPRSTINDKENHILSLFY